MFWKVAADAVVFLHLAWILFIIFGALVGRLVRWVKWVHIGALTFSVLMQVFGWICPLTWLEVWLRRQHDPRLAYPGDFIARYAEGLVYLPASRLSVFLVTLLVVALSTWAYWPRRRSP